MILGAGNTGSYLAGILSMEGHSITIIDKDKLKIDKVSDQYDVIAKKGNASDFTVLEQAGISNADMLIAVTNIDEINIVACFVADKLGVKEKIARVRAMSYYNSSLISMAELGINQMINPEEVVANDIYNLIDSPSAFEVAEFSEGRFMLKGYRISERSVLRGRYIKDIVSDISVFANCTITMILRDNDVIIPRGDDYIIAGDKVYIVSQANLFGKFAHFFNENYKPIKKVFIVGANNISAFFIEKARSKGLNIDITLFDRDPADCEEFGKRYGDIKIVNANPTEETDELVQEGLADADAFISVSLEQDVNILSSLIAKKYNVRKTIVSAVRPDVFPFYNMTSIDAVVSKELSTTGNIMKFVRRGELSGVTPLANKRAEILEFKITGDRKINNVPLKDVKLPKDSIIAYILRGNNIIVPKGNTSIRQGDHVYFFALSSSVKALCKIFD